MHELEELRKLVEAQGAMVSLLRADVDRAMGRNVPSVSPQDAYKGGDGLGFVTAEEALEGKGGDGDTVVFTREAPEPHDPLAPNGP